MKKEGVFYSYRSGGKSKGKENQTSFDSWWTQVSVAQDLMSQMNQAERARVLPSSAVFLRLVKLVQEYVDQYNPNYHPIKISQQPISREDLQQAWQKMRQNHQQTIFKYLKSIIAENIDFSGQLTAKEIQAWESFLSPKQKVDLKQKFLTVYKEELDI